MIGVAILAGGLGSRLRSVSGDLPKPMVPACGTPLLGRQLEVIAASQIRDVAVLAGYRADVIADYVGNGANWGLNVRCIAEQTARGTAGAVLDAAAQLPPRIVVMYGDVVLDVDLDRLIAAHERHAPVATLVVHPNDHPFDSDIIEVDDDDFVTRVHGYPHPPGVDFRNLVNAGLYVLETGAVAQVSGLPDKPDFGKHVFGRMVDQGMRLYAYRSPEYVKDAGTPERLAKASRDLASGRVARMSLREPAPAIFLDRDGVLNEERGLISRPDDLTLIKGAGEAVARINHSDYRSVVITNQPVVARGDCTPVELNAIHARLDSLLAEHGAFVDALYHCPHHPDRGFDGEVPALKIACGCRKPETGMIEAAVRDLNIDVARSWMIGDTTTDLELARRSGLRFVLVRTGHAGGDGRFAGEAEFVADDLASAVDMILERVVA